MGIKIIPIWRDKKITWHPCHNIQSWLTSWNICCCRVMFVWQDSWWSCLILAMDIEELYFKWTYKYIRWWYWWNILTVIIDPEVRHYSYCSWRQRLLVSYCCRDAEVRYCSWVRNSRRIDSRVSYYCSVPEVRDCWYDLEAKQGCRIFDSSLL